MVDDRDRLDALFHSHLAAGLHHGAQLAVYHRGEPVVDLAGGTTGPEGEDIELTDRMVWFSATKPLTAVCVHRLAEDGRLAYDDPIVVHWPAFADEGTDKAAVTIRHVLSHQGGFPYGPFDGAFEDWPDWSAVVAAMEAIDLRFEPGTDAAYHPMTYGWVLGELVRRVSGQPIDEYARDHVCEPLGMTETHMGLPEGMADDVVTLTGFEGFDRVRSPAVGLAADRPATAERFNAETIHRAVMPAAGGLGPARDLARFYAAMADGGALDGTRILQGDTVETATTIQAEPDPDGTLGVPRRYALGFVRAGTATDKFGALAPPRTFGHGGLGSSVGWADPEADLAVAYVTNGIRDRYEHRVRVNEVSDAVRRVFATA